MGGERVLGETNEIHRQYNLAQRVLFSPAQLILFYLKIRERGRGIESPRKLASFILACSLDARGPTHCTA